MLIGYLSCGCNIAVHNATKKPMKKAIYIAAISFSVLMPFRSDATIIATSVGMMDEVPALSLKIKSMFTFQVHANTYNELENELGEIDTSFVRHHPIDMEVAKRIYLFEETYAYFSEAAPGTFSDQKVIHKPVIYKYVNKIEKHYRKQFRTGAIPREQASEQLCKILDTAIILFYYNTDKFEKALKDTRSAADLQDLFIQVQIIESDV